MMMLISKFKSSKEVKNLPLNVCVKFKGGVNSREFVG